MTDVKTPFMRVFASLFILLSVSISSHSAHAGTTTADFLKWERKSQVSYFQISISMLTTIAAQTKPNIANCLNDWYYADEQLRKRRYDEIIEVMPQYHSYHPSTVILAFIENACGQFERN